MACPFGDIDVHNHTLTHCQWIGIISKGATAIAAYNSLLNVTVLATL